MSRIRSIKPEFFLHDGLAALDPLVRLLFVGLWTVADREGRLHDNPRRLKATLLPYDECNVSAMLDVLAGAGFVVRYEADGSAYIAVLSFPKHQCPNVKEAPSTIPAPCLHHESISLMEGREGKELRDSACARTLLDTLHRYSGWNGDAHATQREGEMRADFPTLDLEGEAAAWAAWADDAKKPPRNCWSSFRNWCKRSAVSSPGPDLGAWGS